MLLIKILKKKETMEDYKKNTEKHLKDAELIRMQLLNAGEKATEIEYIFPELKESEDERIRKELIGFLKFPLVNKNLTYEKVAPWIVWLEKQGEPQDKGEISDGYHTFNELYYYRMLYNAAFFNRLPKEWVHKSKRHHTGEECFGGGWFIVMAELPTGQISNHYELKDWDLFHVQEKEIADEWDGHSPQEAAKRLHEFLLEKQGEWKPTWSEEDELNLKQAIYVCHQNGYTAAENWLKLLKDKVVPQWKPTNEQLSVLKIAIKDYGICAEKNILESLYNDLKKL